MDLEKEIQNLVETREKDSRERIFDLIENFDKIVAKEGIDKANKFNAKRFMRFDDEYALRFYGIEIGEKTPLCTVIRKARVKIHYDKLKKLKEIEDNNYKKWVNENKENIKFLVRFLKENKIKF